MATSHHDHLIHYLFNVIADLVVSTATNHLSSTVTTHTYITVMLTYFDYSCIVNSLNCHSLMVHIEPVLISHYMMSRTITQSRSLEDS